MDALHTTVLCLASAVGGEQHDACDMPEINPFPLGSYSWIDTYQSSIDESSLYHRDRVHNCDARWSKLRLMADHPSVEFASWSQSDEDEWEQSIGQIDNPVLVVTWAFSTLPNASESIADVLSPRRTMQEYVTSEQEAPATLWFTMHGNALEYLDALDLDRSCFNMMLDGKAADNAILWGVPTVGVPYSFQECELPYGDVLGAWWREYVLIGVADREAFVRPSYNPSVRPATSSLRTRDGVPIWSNLEGRYALADAQRHPQVFAAQQSAINGPPPFDFKAYNLDGTSETDFSQWLDRWQQDCWVPTEQPGSEYVNGFPFTSIGLTGNWLASGPDPAIDSGQFLALSEFVLKADAPIWWLGVRSAPQYMGIPDFEAGQVSWCDSCLGDIDMSGAVDVGDLIMLVEAWGTRNPGMLFGLGASSSECDPAEVMPPVGVDDLLWLLSRWGECNGWPEGLESLRPADCE